MEKGDYLSAILRSDRTVFSTSDVSLLWQEANQNAIRVRLNYYVRNGDLYRIRKNFYSKDENYDRMELANRLYSPSYISFETVLAREGMVFQYSSVITVAAYLSRTVRVEGQQYSYRRIKESILLAPDGLMINDAFSIASRERAFLDMLYSSPGFYFDSLSGLDWDKVFDILTIYRNKRLEKEINKIFREKDLV